MKAVRQDRNRPGGVPDDDFDQRDREIEGKNAVENADDLRVTIGQFKMQDAKFKTRTPFAFCISNDELHVHQKMCAVGIGHHRSCTLPMMYFLGTKPQ